MQTCWNDCRNGARTGFLWPWENSTHWVFHRLSNYFLPILTPCEFHVPTELQSLISYRCYHTTVDYQRKHFKLYAHGMRPVRFLSACVWFRDVTSSSNVSDMVCVRVESISTLTHQTHCFDSLLLERRPYQTHQKRMWRHEIRRMRPKNAQDACRVHLAVLSHLSSNSPSFEQWLVFETGFWYTTQRRFHILPAQSKRSEQTSLSVSLERDKQLRISI